MAEPSPHLKRLSLVARHSPVSAPAPSEPSTPGTPTRRTRPQSVYADVCGGDLGSFAASAHRSNGSRELDLASPSPTRSRLSYLAQQPGHSSASEDSAPGTPGTPRTPGTPSELTPRRHQNKRSSISYSPSPAHSGIRTSLERSERSSTERSDRRSSLGILLEAQAAPAPPLTLAEK